MLTSRRWSQLAALEGQQVVAKKAETGEIALPKAMEEALHKTISALPDQLVADTKLTSATKTTQDMVSKLEVLQEQIQAIKTEEKEKKEKEREEKAKAPTPATEAEAKQAKKDISKHSKELEAAAAAAGGKEKGATLLGKLKLPSPTMNRKKIRPESTWARTLNCVVCCVCCV
jgi:type IV secretory pathway VirB10-like protein